MLLRRARHRMRCRNATRGRDVLDVTVYVGPRGPAVGLRLNDAEALLLTPLQVGWLRGQLRDAAVYASELAERIKRDRGGA